MTDGSGALVEHDTYSPFGALLNASVLKFGYEGKEADVLVGDTDFHARKYRADLGIFTQPDTVIPNVYDPQTLNRYSFERNNPYKHTDPTGHIVPLILYWLVIFFIVEEPYIEDAVTEYGPELMADVQAEFLPSVREGVEFGIEQARDTAGEYLGELTSKFSSSPSNTKQQPNACYGYCSQTTGTGLNSQFTGSSGPFPPVLTESSANWGFRGNVNAIPG